jgi:hypothetical protein
MNMQARQQQHSDTAIKLNPLEIRRALRDSNDRFGFEFEFEFEVHGSRP